MLLSPLVSAHIQLSQTLVGSTLLSAATPTPTPSPSGTPTPSPTSSGALADIADNFRTSIDSIQAQSAVACTKSDISVCGIVTRLTGKQGLGQILEVVLGTPLRLLLIIGFGVLVRRALHRLIDRLSERIATGAANATPSRTAATGTGTGGTEPNESASSEPGAPVAGTSPPPLLSTRRQARSRTLAQVLRSLTTIAITLIVTLMVLQELHFEVAPLLSVAGVFGVALGFGAQSLVRDVVSGMFMIVEDQYGVGDVVDVGAASGSVEAVGLRITRLRDVNGTVWYIRNGEILRVGNQSQGWARAVLDVNIGYTEDIDHAEEVLLETAQQVRNDPRYAAFVIDEPEVWGVEALTTDGVVMRVVVKTQPLQQWVVARELRRRIKMRLDAEGIEMRTMPRTVIVNDDEEPEPRSAARADDLEH
ncbi:MAG TPA: mechanosensitive ion channel family protein [Kineosporiaceae bacterium]|nr:mechanosensitive ion channel family protein [Kineosporiaceae bacterium]